MQSDSLGLSANDARALTRRVLELCQADHTRVAVRSGRRRYTRCANNRITSAGGSTDVTVAITSAFGRRIATVTTNRLDDASLAEAVHRSEALARIAPENPEYLGELGAQSYPEVSGHYAATAELSSESMAAAVAGEIRAAEASAAVAAGYVDVRAGSASLATSGGLFAHHASTGVASTLTVRTPDGSSSGWGGDEAADWSEIETDRIAADAVRKCNEWQGPGALDAGHYDVVLEPTAVGMLMLRMAGAFDSRMADEGRSAFARPGGGNRLGEQLFDPRLSISSDPATPNAETQPFDAEGRPRSATSWVRDGRLETLSASRFWAQQQGVDSLAGPANLLVSGGEASVEEMIAATKRGVLITRLWYVRGLDPRTLSYTGLTRDGTFLIEDGKIARPVNNFRFNQSLVEMLSSIDMLGRPRRVAAGENSSVGTPVVVPPMKVRGFHLASVSDAI